MGHEVERDWITESGLRAIAVVVQYNGRKSHRCGYVEVPKENPLFGVEYSDPTPVLGPQESTSLGKKGALLVVTAGVRAMDGDTVRRSPDIAFDVHGGLTYSGAGDGYPAKSDGWWFGFDCHHSGDGDIEPDTRYSSLSYGVARSLEYVVAECESLATQIAAATKAPVAD